MVKQRWTARGWARAVIAALSVFAVESCAESAFAAPLGRLAAGPGVSPVVGYHGERGACSRHVAPVCGVGLEPFCLCGTRDDWDCRWICARS